MSYLTIVTGLLGLISAFVFFYFLKFKASTKQTQRKIKQTQARTTQNQAQAKPIQCKFKQNLANTEQNQATQAQKLSKQKLLVLNKRRAI